MRSLQLLVAVATLTVSVGLSHAQSQPEVSFSGKEITILVPFKSGGGTDRWARFWAPLIADRLPGKPTVKVRNIVGGGSTKGANQFARTATNDGLTLLTSSVSVLFPYLLNDRRVEYDYNDWHALLVSGTGGLVFAQPELVDNQGQLITDKQHRILLQGPSQLGSILMLSMEILGLDYAVDFGSGGASISLRSFSNKLTDVDIKTTVAFLSGVAPMIEEEQATVLFSLGKIAANGEVVRDNTFPEYPTFVEYYQKQNGNAPSGIMFDAWREFFEAGFPYQKMLILRSDTDPAIKEAYVTAINDIIADNEVMPIARKELIGEYPQYTGSTAQQLMLNATQISPAVLDWYRNWVYEKFNIKI